MSNSHSKRPRFFELFPFSFRDLKITLLILLVAVTFCILLQRMEPSAGFSMPVFVLTVLLTSWLTNGYFWGLLSAVLGVIAVNYFFTYPFWSFNLTITGYPLSFLTFLKRLGKMTICFSMSLITVALETTKINRTYVCGMVSLYMTMSLRTGFVRSTKSPSMSM